MSFTLGIVGIGQFGSHFAELFAAHPEIEALYACDAVPERIDAVEARGVHFAGRFATLEELLASDVDAVAIFTQRWTHGEHALAALRAGKHVYSAVPMAIEEEEIRAITEEVRRTGLVYMMGETSQYNAAVVLARRIHRTGAFGEVFYAEGDYVHDMDLGFYDAYRYSGGEQWKATASYPPLLYPTHSLGGVFGVLGERHATSVSALGRPDTRGDGVFDTEVSMFGNDVSNAFALFGMDNGGAVRTNELRRVGYPSHKRESRFRFFGEESSFEETVATTYWHDKSRVLDVTELIATGSTMSLDDPRLADVSPALRDAFVAGAAAVHHQARLPREFQGLPNGHEGAHHFLVDDFARAVADGHQPVVNAWQAARYTLPGVIAHESMTRGGERLEIRDLGESPLPVVDLDADQEPIDLEALLGDQ
ncbi:Gfo/Idh/MocA family protein [Brachybacterium saurashtrense]|uniref:Gfo/Idh/MocA family oxidoreductase n=1 Tax=Brachybacterium saurashtrense TaxID=556288 RepID=A0A345YPZ6_9MICO|nr:Gfo/Idh/MocA family oxidoreductase [Brachybacterium saurashtrense]AXK45998.1 gfo/Idh/MocA family oxidoreductase [Brachybacterium saurashtrense]RRR23737.1 gfo/Idh/MocA family oxidoreductase [Brachybacterium saurashtrense]